MEKLTTNGRRIIEAESGGEAILHGLNLVCKKPEKGFPPCTRKDLAWMAGQGFNLLRLGVNWAAAAGEDPAAQTALLAALDNREQLLALLADETLFQRILRAGAVPAGQWEEKVLSPFYEKLAAGLDGVMLPARHGRNPGGMTKGSGGKSFAAFFCCFIMLVLTKPPQLVR